MRASWLNWFWVSWLLLGKNLLFSLSSHGRRENLTFLEKIFEKNKKSPWEPPKRSSRATVLSAIHSYRRSVTFDARLFILSNSQFPGQLFRAYQRSTVSSISNIILNVHSVTIKFFYVFKKIFLYKKRMLNLLTNITNHEQKQW